ncbi:MAG TPA: (Fe-S)-binding protein [Desulfosporosinus sp.]|nr:(Fe-S)-binding protein [Desulfosporosinus sp.]
MGHLTLAKDEVYLALAQRLDKNPVGAPLNPTLMQILHIIYSQTQAFIGSKFPLEITSLNQLSTLTGLNPIELREHLNSMANKGLVIDFTRNGVSYYMLSPLVIGFFEYTFMRVNETLPMYELAQLFHAYHNEPGVVQEFYGSNTKFFQTMAYESLLPNDVETEVLSYEKASQIIRDAGGGSLTMCYCRHQAAHLGTKTCNAPIEDVCTSLGNASEWLIKRGFARPASMDELLRVLDKTEELGLVHLADNVQKNPAYICHCCGCCCGVLKATKEHRFLSAQPSNFMPQINEDKCNGCGTCAKNCHIEGIRVLEKVPGDKKSKKARVIEDLCLGCGVCVKSCKQNALTLVQRKTIYIPPKNKKEQMQRIALEKGK